ARRIAGGWHDAGAKLRGAEPPRGPASVHAVGQRRVLRFSPAVSRADRRRLARATGEGRARGQGRGGRRALGKASGKTSAEHAPRSYNESEIFSLEVSKSS